MNRMSPVEKAVLDKWFASLPGTLSEADNHYIFDINSDDGPPLKILVNKAEAHLAVKAYAQRNSST